MAINSISPTTFTTGVLITDTGTFPGGSPDSITTTITPSVALDVQSTLGGFCVPRMTSAQIAALPNNNGMIAYNTTTNSFVNWAAGAPVPTFPIPILTNNTNNIFMGFNTGNVAALATSGDNLLIGIAVAPGITTGSANVAVGIGALAPLTTGSNNTAVGLAALDGLIAGSNNTSIGSNSLGLDTVASQCTGIGAGAGADFNNLTSCTFLGYNSDVDTNGLSNAMALGANAVVHTSNSCVIGDGTVNLGIGISSPVARIHAVSSAGLALKSSGGIASKVTQNAGTPYNILASDYIVGQTATGVPISLVLPAVSAGNTNQIYVIKDQSGLAGTNNITVSTADAALIDGLNTKLIASNYGTITVYNNGTDWFTIQ